MIQSNRLKVERAIAQEQHSEIQGIQQEVLQTRDLVKDIAVLINDQGDAIDHIEESVETAQAKVDKGVSELHGANTYQKRNRKLKCCCLIIALVVIVSILVPALLLNNNSASGGGGKRRLLMF